MNISSAGLIPIETLVPNWKDCHDYFPTSYSAFREALGCIEIRPGEEVFVDIGSGKGRVLALAAELPFRRVIGVEIAPELNIAARRNLALPAQQARALCKDVQIWEGSAADFPIPPDATVIYLYNPFRGELLRSVLENLRVSLQQHPRRMFLIYNNPWRFLPIAHEYPWLTERRRFQFEHTCVVYESVHA